MSGSTAAAAEGAVSAPGTPQEEEQNKHEELKVLLQTVCLWERHWFRDSLFLVFVQTRQRPKNCKGSVPRDDEQNPQSLT